jgi:hypothetical protein
MLTRILSVVIVLKTKIIVSTVNKSMVNIILSMEIKKIFHGKVYIRLNLCSSGVCIIKEGGHGCLPPPPLPHCVLIPIQENLVHIS